MILIWREDIAANVCITGSIINDDDLDEMGIIPNRCIPVNEPFPPIVREIESPKTPADFFMAGSYFIGSDRLVTVLRRFEVDAHYLPITETRQRGSRIPTNYFFVNILDAVECFDFKRSEYTMTERGATGITKTVLIERKARGHHLFLLGQRMSPKSNSKAVFSVVEFASEELALAVLDAGITGVVFVKPIHERDYPPPDWRTS